MPDLAHADDLALKIFSRLRLSKFLPDRLIVGIKRNLLFFLSGPKEFLVFVFKAVRSSNGRTTGSGPVNLGSSPSLTALKRNEKIGVSGTVYLGSSPSLTARIIKNHFTRWFFNTL